MWAIRALGIWAVSFAFVWVTPLESAATPACYNLFRLPPSSELPARLKIATFNTQELGKAPDKFESEFEQAANRERELARNKEIKKLLNDMDADVLVLTEVMNPLVAKELAGRLTEKISLFWAAGNDPYGHGIAILLKSDLPVTAAFETHRHLTWVDPVTSQREPRFIRDAPALILRKKGETAPYLIVIGVHSKSQRSRPGDPRSELMRSSEFEAYVSIIRGYQKRFGDKTKIILAGDLNTDVMTSPEMYILNQVIVSAFDVAKIATREDARVTHTFHPRDGPSARHQIDDIRVLPFLSGIVEKAYVYRYRNEDGSTRPFAETFEERQQQPSDHLPVVVEINTQNSL